jgi:hypothetical protein
MGRERAKKCKLKKNRAYFGRAVLMRSGVDYCTLFSEFRGDGVVGVMSYLGWRISIK